jgi:hypothetical protein
MGLSRLHRKLWPLARKKLRPRVSEGSSVAFVKESISARGALQLDWLEIDGGQRRHSISHRWWVGEFAIRSEHFYA